jgi:hypothetical protein
MHLYIPFIHKLPKKEKFVPEQIPLYIDAPLPVKKEKENKEVKKFIIELF